MVIASTGGRPQLRFYLSIVIQIGENIPTNQGQLKNFRPIIKSLTSGDWSVIRILRDQRSGVGWRLGWMTCPVTWWPRTGQAGGTLTNERNVNVIPAQRIVFQDTSSERGREWRRWQDVVIVFVAGPHHWAISLAPSIMESCQAAISSSLPSLSLWPSTQSQAQSSELRSRPTFTRQAHPPGAFPPFHSQHQLFLSTFPFNVRPVLTTPDYFQQEIYSV